MSATSEAPAGAVRDFRLPDPGEGLHEAEIVAWRVAPGDTVAINDVIVEVETAKAVVELPCPYAGTVVQLHAEIGQTVPVGEVILTVAEPAAAARPDGTAPPSHEATVPATSGVPAAGARPVVVAPAAVAPGEPVATPSAEPALVTGPDDAAESSGPVLVGYGVAAPRAREGGRRRRFERRHHAAAAGASGQTLSGGSAYSADGRTPARAQAKPPVRRLARGLGIDLDGIRGTGPGGLVTREDVLTAAERAGEAPDTAAPARPVAATGLRPVPAPVVPQPGDVRVPIRGVRKAIAENMVLSAYTAPHVTEWVQVDVTPTVEFVARMREDKEFVGLRVSSLLVVAKAVCLAARRNPGVNATWDDATQEIVLREQVNLGIAAATARGLVVPVIHGADRMHMPRLAQELTDIVATAREGRLQPAQMAGGTVTITNVGVFGVDGGTPILPPGQAAIITMGQIRQLPWVHEGQIVPRHVATLSVSFDHRLVDGELGSSFLTDVAAVLADPARGLIWA